MALSGALLLAWEALDDGVTRLLVARGWDREHCEQDKTACSKVGRVTVCTIMVALLVGMLPAGCHASVAHVLVARLVLLVLVLLVLVA